MDIRLINIGFGNIVAASRVIAIVSPESAPIKRIISLMLPMAGELER
jgi:extracellular matrix regulatory protein A